jgi:hypothetical protein
MGASGKGRHKLTVNGRLFYWWVVDQSSHEGFWTLEVLSQDRRFHVTYPLIEQKLVAVAADSRKPPLPPGFDANSMQLCQGSAYRSRYDYLGPPDHATVTPRFVRELIIWLQEHEPRVDTGDYLNCCIWPTM